MNATQRPIAEPREWTLIKPYADTSFWISGIYKIVSYRAGEFHAYYMPDHYENWGDNVSPPPDHGKRGKCWASLETAQAACDAHALKHVPKPRTVKRAAEVKTHLLSSVSGAAR